MSGVRLVWLRSTFISRKFPGVFALWIRISPLCRRRQRERRCGWPRDRRYGRFRL